MLVATESNKAVQEDHIALKRQRARERESEAADAKRLAAAAEGSRIGDAGYRYHARVPRAARPDYVTAPAVADNVRFCLFCRCAVRLSMKMRQRMGWCRFDRGYKAQLASVLKHCAAH